MIELVLGDITRETVDAIVNAANTSLLGGGGVDGAIHKAGGAEILEQCKAIRTRQGGCKPGHAVITGGGNLSARHVIHTVGPVYHDGTHGEAETLANAYRNSLQLAAEHGLRSIAFPSISTGAYGYPVDRAAAIALSTVAQFLADHRGLNVRFVLFSQADLECYRKALAKL